MVEHFKDHVVSGAVAGAVAQRADAKVVALKVYVDHGPTSCKKPDAATYIAKMVTRRRRSA